MIPRLARPDLRAGIIQHAHHDAGPLPVLDLNDPAAIAAFILGSNQRIDQPSLVVIVTYPAIQSDDLSPFSR